MAKFLHIGIPTPNVQENEIYLENLMVYVTNPEEHPYQYEYLRFEKGTPFPYIMQVNPHVAYEVENIEEEIKNASRIIVDTFDADENTKIAFIIKDSVIFELVEYKK